MGSSVHIGGQYDYTQHRERFDRRCGKCLRSLQKSAVMAEVQVGKVSHEGDIGKGIGRCGVHIFSGQESPVGKDTTLTAVISASDGELASGTMNVWTKEIRIKVGAPKDYQLYNNFPNPFNQSTKIAFELPKSSHVKLVIYDIIGREVAQIADGEYPAGYTELTWNGTNRNGAHVSSGVYFYRMTAGNWSKVMKMLMVK